MCTKTTKTRVIVDSQAEEEDKGAAAMGYQGHVSHCSVPLLSPQAHTVAEIQRRSESARSRLTTRVAQAITVTTAMMASSAMQSSSPSSMHSEPEGVQTWGIVKDILSSMQTRAELAHYRSTLLSGARLHHTPVHRHLDLIYTCVSGICQYTINTLFKIWGRSAQVMLECRGYLSYMYPRLAYSISVLASYAAICVTWVWVV